MENINEMDLGFILLIHCKCLNSFNHKVQQWTVIFYDHFMEPKCFIL